MQTAHLLRNGSSRWRQDKTPHSLRIAAENDVVFRVFSGGEHGNPAGGSIYARLELPASSVPPASLLMTYEDGVPALARISRAALCSFGTFPLDASRAMWRAAWSSCRCCPS